MKVKSGTTVNRVTVAVMSWHGLVAYDETKRGSREGERERVKERVGREKKSVKEGERGRRRGREGEVRCKRGEGYGWCAREGVFM